MDPGVAPRRPGWLCSQSTRGPRGALGDLLGPQGIPRDPRALVGRALMGQCLMGWDLVGRALMGPAGPLWTRPLWAGPSWASLGSYGPGRYGPPWALMGRPSRAKAS